MSEKKYYVAGRFAYKTDIGKIRSSNEDSASAFVNEKGNVLLLVCDGMGGHNKGEFASSLTCKFISQSFLKKGRFLSAVDCGLWLQNVVKKVNNALYKKSNEDPAYKGMGTTLSLALIYNDKLFTVHIGDSRIYMVKNHCLNQVSEDQTYANYLYKQGKINQEQISTHPKRHMLINALGVKKIVSYSYNMVLYSGESIMLCSDGLYNNLSSAVIQSVLLSDSSTTQKVDQLITFSNTAGGSDNIAVVLWEAQ